MKAEDQIKMYKKFKRLMNQAEGDYDMILFLINKEIRKLKTPQTSQKEGE